MNSRAGKLEKEYMRQSTVKNTGIKYHVPVNRLMKKHANLCHAIIVWDKIDHAIAIFLTTVRLFSTYC